MNSPASRSARTRSPPRSGCSPVSVRAAGAHAPVFGFLQHFLGAPGSGQDQGEQLQPALGPVRLDGPRKAACLGRRVVQDVCVAVAVADQELEDASPGNVCVTAWIPLAAFQISDSTALTYTAGG